MGFQSVTLFIIILSLISYSPVVFSQQPYRGRDSLRCSSTDKTTTSSGYFCNGQHPSCQSYLSFRSQPPYNSVDSISTHFSSDPFQILQLNPVRYSDTIPTEMEVIVPVNCSCSGEYYQANTTYSVVHGNTQYLIATSIYQGLTTCHSVLQLRTTVSRMLFTGMNLTIPLRCACPTSNQISNGVKYFLTYTVRPNDSISSISKRVSVDPQSILDANELSDLNFTLYPNTTLLIPLKNKPSSFQTIAPSPQPSFSPSSSRKNSTTKWVYAAIGFAVGAFVIFFVFCISCIRKARKPDLIGIAGGTEMSKETPTNSKVAREILKVASDISHFVKIYKFEELQSATDDFCEASVISRSVYRGVIDQNPVAIKQVATEVSKEINILKNIHHFNLIQLLGVCFNQGYWYLVYEYAERGSLRDWMCNGSALEGLGWIQRLKIALDVAHGLEYLHSYTEPAYVHKDIKSSNILLDGDFRAKIANFAMVKMVEELEGGFALTEHVVGTKGYMAPEYLENGLVSPKLDVYAFGVVMLEIITGKQAVITVEQGGDMFLSDTLITVLHDQNVNEKLRDLIDPSLQGNYPPDLALLLAKLIEGCLGRNAACRPSMDGIVQFLSKILATSLTWELSSKLLDILSNGNQAVEPIDDELDMEVENGDGTYGT